MSENSAKFSGERQYQSQRRLEGASSFHHPSIAAADARSSLGHSRPTK
ncbi:MAG: hypothetical protein L3K00_01695 [Thermoplasmata archaeon]|nr:hypothetical protein [Thermoplasmata archaeon]